MPHTSHFCHTLLSHAAAVVVLELGWLPACTENSDCRRLVLSYSHPSKLGHWTRGVHFQGALTTCRVPVCTAIRHMCQSSWLDTSIGATKALIRITSSVLYVPLCGGFKKVHIYIRLRLLPPILSFGCTYRRSSAC